MNNYFWTSLENLINRSITGVRSHLPWSMAVMLMVCAGCVAPNTPSPDYAPEAQNKAAKDISVPTGKSLVFVYQDQPFFTQDNLVKKGQFTLQVDQRDVCRLPNHTFYRTVLEPGSHQLALRFVGNWADAGLAPAPIRVEKQLLVDLEPDHLYLFEIDSDSGLRPTGLLLSGLENAVSIDLKKDINFQWGVRGDVRVKIIHNKRVRLTGELIGP